MCRYRRSPADPHPDVSACPRCDGQIGGGYFPATSTTTAANPWWTVSFGIENEASLTIDIIFLLHAEYKLSRSLVFSVQLGKAAGGYPGYIPLAITTITLPTGAVGAGYTATLTATGGTAPYVWAATGLPLGLSLNSGTGKITGTPTTSGVATIRATVTDHAGQRASATLTVPVTGGTSITGKVKQISAGADHACAVLTSGAATCWGGNYERQLGNGTTTRSSVPVPVTGLGSRVASISTSGGSTCAVLTSGAATCWGDNQRGVLGNGTTTNSSVPVPVTGLGSGVASISTSGGSTCAVLTSGAATCWGDNQRGGTRERNQHSVDRALPVIGLGSGVASIRAGGNHTCAVRTSGAATCWGDSTFGQIGNGTDTNSFVPVPVTGLGSGVASISAGANHTCAMRTSGAATC